MQECRADTRNLRVAGSLQAVGRWPHFDSTLQAARRALGPASALAGTAHRGPDYSAVWGCFELAGHLTALPPGTGWVELLMAQPGWFVHCSKYSSESVVFHFSPGAHSTLVSYSFFFSDEEMNSEKGGEAA